MKKILIFLILLICSSAFAQDSLSTPPQPAQPIPSAGALTVTISTPVFPPLPDNMKYKIGMKLMNNEWWYTLEPVERWTFESLKSYWGQLLGVLSGIYLFFSNISKILNILPFKITRKDN